jgi:carbamoyl-phosphate synthase large subunit
MTEPKRILVTGSGGPLGVNVTRSLRKTTEPLWLLGTEANRYHVHLSLTDETERIPPAKETEAYLKALARLVTGHRIGMIFPTHPVEVKTLARHRDRFPGVRFLLPEASVPETADSKWETYRRLEGAGLPVPRTFLIREERDVERVFEVLSTRPVWVRGAGTPGSGIGLAALPCREARHAAAWIDHWNGWGLFIASEYLPGRNLTWTGVYKDGTCVVSQTRERLEYVIPHVSPSGVTGAPAVSRTVRRPELRELGDAAVRTLTPQPTGPFFVDFKEDSGGRPMITEINAGRLGTTVHFYTEAGCNFPHIVVKLAYGERVEGAPLVDPIPPGTYWIRTLDCGPALVTGLSDAP